MSNNKEYCGHIYDGDDFKGSCVPLNSYNNHKCFISAAHVLFGKNHDMNLNLHSMDFKIIYSGNKYKIVDFIFITPTNENDLIILLINEDISLPNVNITRPINNEIFASKQIIITDIIGNTVIDTFKINGFKEKENNNFYCYGDQNSLINRKNDRYGADGLIGISGSGLFYIDSDNEYYLTGITIDIPHAQSGEIKFVNLSLLNSINNNFKVIESTFLDKDNKKILDSIAIMNKKRDQLTSEEWLSNRDNDVQSDNLITKCNQIFHGESVNDIKKEIDKMVMSFLDGNNIIEEWEKNYSQLFSCYKNFFDSQSTDTRMKRYYNEYEIYDIYEDELNKYTTSLIDMIHSAIINHSNAINPQIKSVSKRDIVHFLNECDLRFRRKYNV